MIKIKKSMAKLGAIGILSVVAIMFITLLSISLISSATKSEEHPINEPLKVDLDSGDYTIILITPSGAKLIKKGSGNKFIFTPTELGTYNLRIDQEGKKTSLALIIVENLEDSNPPHQDSENTTQTPHPQENSTNTASENSTDNQTNQNNSITREIDSEPKITTKNITVGQEVSWKKTIVSNGTTEVTLPEFGEDFRAYKEGKEINLEESGSKLMRFFSFSNTRKFKVSEEGQVDITYNTKAPEKKEKKISDTFKEVVISADDELNYTNVIARTALEVSLTKSQADQIQIFWKEENQTLNFTTIDEDNDSLIDSIEWIVPHLSTQTFEISIDILNVQSYPVIGGTWKVNFNTVGREDLWIRAHNETVWRTETSLEDLEFLELKCGDQLVNYEVIDGDIFVEDYECNETSSETVKVLSLGKHDIEFQFGTEFDYAHNLAGAAEGYRVQQGTYDFSGTDEFIPLDFPVENISNAFVIAPNIMNQENVSAASSGDPAAVSNNAFATIYLYNTTHMRVQRESNSDGTFVVTWQVLEAMNNEFTVQRGEHSFSSTGTTTFDTIPNAVTPEDSMSWYYLRTTYAGNDGRIVQWFTNVTNSTAIQFERTSSTATTIYFRWVVVEWDTTKITSFQKGYLTGMTGPSSAPDCDTMSTLVDKSKSILFFQHHAVSDDGLDASARSGYIKDNNEVCFYDLNSPQTAAARWFVIEIPGITQREEATSVSWASTDYEDDPAFTGDFAINKTLMFLTGSCDGDGTAKPRHTQWWYLTGNSENYTGFHVERTYGGQPRKYAWEAVELPFAHNLDSPQFSGASTNKSFSNGAGEIRFNISISDSDGVTAVNGTINGTTHSFTQGSGNEWYYDFQCTEDGDINFTYIEASDNGDPQLSNSTIISGVTLTCDSVEPLITLNESTPKNNTYVPESYFSAYLNLTETNFGNITFSLYNSTSIVNQTTYTSEVTSINWTGLPSEEYYYNITIYDAADNYNSTETRTITIDLDNPQIDFGSGTEVDFANKSQNFVYINTSVTETNEANITFYLFNESHSMIQESTFSDGSRTMQWGLLPQGTYYYNVTIIDKANRQNSTSTRAITLDTTSPFANLTTPVNETYTNQTSQNLTVNTTDNSQLDNATLFVYNSSNDLINQTEVDLSGSKALVGIVYEFLYDGIFNWFYRIYDLAGNVEDTENNTITIDTTYPQIDFTTGTETNNTNFTRNWIFANVSITETNEANFTYTLYNSTSIYNQITVLAGNYSFNWTSLPDDEYYYNVTITDKSGQQNFTETRIIRLDSTGPSVNILSPEVKAYGYNTSLWLNYTIEDNVVGYDKCWWNLNNTVNQSIACGTNTTFNSTEGTNTLYFYSNDTLGNLAATEVVFSISTQGPAVSLIAPSNDTFYDVYDNITFNYSATDPDFVDSCSLYGSWNGGWHLNQTDFKVGTATPDNTDQSCSGIWGFACNTGPPESGGDNTFDSCANGAGNDESVEQIYLNVTSVNPGDAVLVTCEFDPYTSRDDTYIWYYNGTGWRNLYQHLDWGSSSITNESATFTADNNPGTHWVRCGIDYNVATETDACTDGGSSYYDNDDLNFTVLGGGGEDSFIVNISADGNYKWNVKCNDTGSLDSWAPVNLTFGIDTQSPQIEFSSPTEVNNSNKSQNWIFANVSAIETNEANITFTLYNKTHTVNITTYTTPQRTINWTNLPNSEYMYNVTIFDKAVRLNFTETRYILLDRENPFANLTTPLNDTYALDTSQNLTVNTTDNSQLDNATLFVYNSSNDIINQTEVDISGPEALVGIVYEFLYDGIFNWFYRIYDIAGNVEDTENNTITIDTTTPKINFVDQQFNYTEDSEDSTIFLGTPTNPSNGLDDSFSTFATLDSNDGIDVLYANYSVPDAASAAIVEYLADWDLAAGKMDCYTGSVWENIATFIDNVKTNATVPSTCFDQEIFQTRTYHALTPSLGSTNFYDFQTYWQIDSFTEANNSHLSQNWISSNAYIVEENFENITFSLYNETDLVSITTFSNKTTLINWTNLPDANYRYNISTADKVGLVNTTETRYILLDTENPFVNLTTPVNETYTNQTSQNLTVNTTDNSQLDNATLFIYNSSNDLINQTEVDISGPEALVGIVYEFLYDGIFNWFYRIYDIAGNVEDTENNTITIDTTFANIQFESPTEDNATSFEREWIFANVSVVETNEANITFTLYNSTSLVNETTYTTPVREINWTGLSSENEDYYYNVTIIDLAGQINYTETRKITLNDSTSPTLSIVLPQNKTYNYYQNIPLTYNTYDVNPDSCWYNINDGSNVTLPSCTNTTIDVSDMSLNTIYLFANDSVGNLNSKNVTFSTNSSLIYTSDWLVQRGSDFIDGTSLMSLTEIDPKKSFVLLSTRSSDPGPDSLLVASDIPDSTTLSLSNYVSGGGANVEWEVITGPNLTVQRNEETVGTTDATITVDISEVDLSSSFIVVQGRLNDGSGANTVRGFWTGKFNNATQIELQRGTTGSAGAVSWQVVDWAGASVQNGTTTLATTTTATPGLTSIVNLSRSLLIFSNRLTGDNSIQDLLVAGEFISNSQLNFQRVGAGGTVTVDYFVLEWENLLVESGYHEFTSTTTPQNLPLSRELLNLSKSFNINSHESSGGGTTFSNGFQSQKLANTSYVQVQKGTSSNSANTTWLAVEIIENNNPQINLIYPEDSTSLSTDPLYFNFTVSDQSTLENCSLYGDWNGGWHLNQTDPSPDNNGSINQYFPGLDLDEGSNTWNVYCEDMYGNSAFNSSNFTFYIDSIPPKISFVSPTEANNENKSQNWIFANVSITELNEENITFSLYNSTSIVNETTYTSTIHEINWTNLPDGTYYYNVTSYDQVGLSNSTETLTINLDNLAPELELYYPENKSYNTTSLTLNYSVYDTGALSCWYNINETSNITLPSCQNISFESAQGSNTLFLYANDSVGNVNSSNVTYLVDSIYPKIEFVSPTTEDMKYQNNNWIFANVSVIEANEANITFTIYNQFGILNQTTYMSPVHEINWTGLIDGNYTYKVIVVDTLSQSNTTEIRKTIIDSRLPSTNLITPANDTYTNTSSQNLTVNSSDNVGLDNATLFVYNSSNDLINQTEVDISGTKALVGVVYEFLYDGIFNWFYRIYDLAGNEEYSQNNTLIFDTTYPQIDFTTGTENNNTNFTKNWIYVNVSVTETNEANITFTLYNTSSIVHQSTLLAGNRSINWTGLQDGKYTYNVTIIDKANQQNFTESRIITLDNEAPVVNLISPKTKTYGYNESIPLKYTISDNVIGYDQCWWNIDHGTNKSIACGTNTTFNVSEASHKLYFYSNDTLGNLGVTSVSFGISLFGPAITLLAPENESFYSEATEIYFNFSAEDPDGVSTCSLYGDWNGGWHINQTNYSLFGSKDNTDQSCSGIWGFDCGTGPPESGGDNTFDSCANGAGNDESVEQIYLNVTSVNPGDAVLVTCEFDPYTSADDTYIWYYNGTGWRNLYQHLDWGSSSITNESATFTADNNPGTHWVRCGIDYNVATETDACTDGGSSYYDNDDLNFTVLEVEGNSSFKLNLSEDGSYSWNIECNDSRSYDSFSIENFTFGIDTLTPQIEFSSPTEVNNSNKSQNWVFANVSVTEGNEANITFTLYNKTHTVNKTTYTTPQRTINWTNLRNGEYRYNVTIFDKATRQNTTETRYILLDTENPFVNLTTPVNETYTNQTSQNLTVNTTDNSQLDNATLFVYNSSNDLINQTEVDISGPEALVGIVYEFLYDGIFNWFYRIYDIAGNVEDTENNTITIDTTYPQITFVSPTEDNDTFFEKDWVFANVTLVEDNFKSIIFDIYKNTDVGYQLVNRSEYSTVVTEINWTNLINENTTYYYVVTVEDLVGQVNQSEQRFIKLVDMTNPALELTEPQNLNYSYDTSLPLNFSVSDLHSLTCWYNLDGGSNTSIPGCQNTTFNSPQGSHTLYLYAEDSVGNLNSTTADYLVDSISPQIDYIAPTPENDSKQSKNYIELNLSLVEANVKNITYSLYHTESLVNKTTYPSPITEINWTGLVDENYTFYVTVYDIVGHSNRTDNRTIQLDATIPKIEFVSPTEPNASEVEQDWIQAKVSVNEINEKNITFTLYNSSGIINSTTYTTPIRSINWTGLLSSNLTYYYNVSIVDVASNQNSTESREIKLIDTTPPTVVLLSPENTTYSYNTGMHLEYTLTDLNPDTCWYNIDGGANTTLASCEEDFFDVTDEALHTLYFFANDTMGQSVSTNVTFFVNSSLIITDEWVVQRGTFFVDGTFDQPIETSDPKKSFILHTSRSSDAGPDSLQVTGRQLTPTSLEFKNYASGNGANVEWELITGPDLSTQRSEETYGTSTSTIYVNINQINLSSSFIIVNNRLNTGTSSNNVRGFWTGKFVNDSYIQLDRQTTGSSGVVSWQVVDWDNAVVQSGSYSSAAASGTDTLSSAVNLSQSFLIFSSSLSGDTSVQDALLRGYFSSDSELTFQRWANGGTIYAEWFVVEAEILRSQTGNHTHDTVTSLQYDTVSTPMINTSRSFNINSKESAGTGTNFDDGFITQKIINETTLGLQRASSTGSGESTWFAVEIVEVDAPNITLIYPVDENFSSTSIPYFNYSVLDASTIENCSLYGNWSSGWHLNQTDTSVQNNGTLENFNGLEVTIDNFYDWSVTCIDLYGNVGWATENKTFSAFDIPTSPTLYSINQTKKDGTGNIIMEWNSSDHNLLYKIYYANNLSTEFILLNTTSDKNYTDTTFSGNKRRFYRIASWNPVGQNESSEIFGTHVYELHHNGTTRNWIGFPTNFSYLKNANDSLNDITNATTFTLWNETIQSRVTCNKFTCPDTFSCTPTTCNFDLEHGRGYEVNINDSAPSSVNWSGVGIVYDKARIKFNQNATSFAKNWMAIYANTTITNGFYALKNISNVDAVTNWNAETQTSEGLIHSYWPWLPYIGINYELEMEKGYEVSVTTPTVWWQE